MSVEGAKEALWEWHPRHHRLSINKDFCYLSFIPASFIIDNENWTEVIHKDSIQVYNEMLSILKADQVFPEIVEFQIKTIEGDYKWVLIRGKKCELTQNNELISFLGTIHDISSYKQILADLISSQHKAEESDKLKTAFLNNVSHEIRTPMNAIVGFSDLLCGSDILLEKKQLYAKLIDESCFKLIQIIEDLIDISQITTGNIQTVNREINISELLDRVNQKYYSMAESKGLVLNCPSIGEVFIHIDESKIFRILCNLIDNAIKFTKSGTIEIGFKKNHDKITFYVQDTGIGIDKIYHEAIFQNFRQVELSTTRDYGGHGLGLSICKGLVDIMGGKIWIESELEKGTTIFFTIPMDEPKEIIHLQKSKIEASILTKYSKILIAEDEDSNFIYLKEILNTKFEIILRAHDGLEAINLFKSNPDVAMILMDIKMPVMNGIDAAKEIKLINPGIPIIAQTAFSFEQGIEHQINSTCDSYLIKPISKDSLLKEISLFLKIE